MLQLFGSGLVALWFGMAGVRTAPPNAFATFALQSIPGPVWFAEANPATAGVLQRYLAGFDAQNMAQTEQGIWFQAGPILLADNQGTQPLPAASLTKIATTLAALATWNPEHQFETSIAATGAIEAGVLQGDLVVQGGQDPLFVWEEAMVLGNRLNQMGIRQVTGDLIVSGDFYMNFKTDPQVAGQLFKQALDSRRWSPAAVAQYQQLPPGTPKPQVAIAGSVKVQSQPILSQATAISFVRYNQANVTAQNTAPVTLVRHRSLPLAVILKQMNVYSNNAMSEMIADAVGGPYAVSQQAAEAAAVPPEEIQLINGSGLGVENRVSPRAAVAMLGAIQRSLQSEQLTVADLFPVSGRDRKGTLYARGIPAGSAVKTGTLRDVSALAGVMPTRDRGLVWFAIINRGSNVPKLRQQQDQLLQNSLQQWGTAISLPDNITPSPMMNRSENQIGSPARNEVLAPLN